MAEQVDFTAKFDDAQLTAAMRRLADALDTGQVKFDALGEAGSQAFKEIATAIELVETQTAQAAAQTGNFTTAAAASGKTIKLTANEAKNLAFQLQDVFVQLASGQGIFRTLLFQGPQITSIFGGVGKTFKFFGQQALSALKSVFSLRGGLASLAVAATALIAVPLGAYLAKSGKAAETFALIGARVNAFFETAINRAAGFGETIAKFTRGQASFGQVMKAAGDAVRGFGSEVNRAADEAQALQEQLNALKKEQVGLTLINIELQKQAQLLNIQAEDQNKTIGQRIKLSKQAAAIEKETRETQISLLDREIALLVQAGNTGEALQKKIVERNKLVAESDVAQAEAAAKINGLIKERQNELEQLRKAYADLLQTLGQRVADAELAQVEGFDKLALARAQAIQEVQSFRDEIVKAATAAGRELPATFASDIQELIDAVEAEFRRAADKLANRSPEDANLLLNSLLPGFGQGRRNIIAAGEQAVGELGAALDKKAREEAEKLKPIGQRITESIRIAFGLNETQLQYIAQQASTAFGSVVDGITASTEAAITAQDKILEAIDNRIQETTRLLNEEEEKQKQGYANNVDALKQRLNEENKEREAAEKKRLDLERKAARQRLVINSAEQISNYVLAVTKLSAAEASKGLVGIATAIAGVALLAGIIARARATSKQFEEAPKFAQGGPVSDGAVYGPSHSYGGRRIEVEGGEYVVRRSVAEQARPFLDQLNAGKIDLAGLIGQSAVPSVVASAREGQQRLFELKAEVDHAALIEGVDRAMSRHTKEMIEYWKSRPTEYPTENGKVVEWQEGQTLVRKIVKD